MLRLSVRIRALLYNVVVVVVVISIIIHSKNVGNHEVLALWWYKELLRIFSSYKEFQLLFGNFFTTNTLLRSVRSLYAPCFIVLLNK